MGRKFVVLSVLLAIACVVVAGFFLCSKNSVEKMKVASFNMAFCRNTNDLKVWEARKNQIPDLIKSHGFDVCGSQEPYAFQVRWLAERMEGYAFVEELMGDETPEKFKGRSPKHISKDLILPNMNNPIWYKKDRFEVLKSGKFWFSKTPEKPSGGFSENRFDSQRHCTWALFLDKKTGKEFYFFNVHMVCRRKKDDPEQIKGMELLISKIREIAGEGTFFVTGDFNANSNCGSIKIALNSDYLINSRSISQTPPSGPEYSFCGFRGEAKKSSMIDHIFVSKNVKVFDWETIDDHIGDVYPSDHMPIAATVGIE